MEPENGYNPVVFRFHASLFRGVRYQHIEEPCRSTWVLHVGQRRGLEHQNVLFVCAFEGQPETDPHCSCGGGGRPGGRNECEMSFAIAGEEEAYTATFSHIPWGGQEQYPKALGHTVEELDISQVSCGVLPQVPPKAQPSVTPARASLCQMDPANSLP